MELKQNPFSFYDFLGYFTPGAILIYSSLVISAHAEGCDLRDAISNQLTFDHGELYIPFVIAAYVTGHVLSFISSITIEQFSIWSIGYPSKYLLDFRCRSYFDVDAPKRLHIALRAFIGVALAPVSIPDALLGRAARFRELYARPLDALLIKIIKQKIVALVTQHAKLAKPEQLGKAKDHDFFRYAYHYALENAPAHGPKMQNYVALYGFLRTLTLLSVIFSWTMVWHAFRYPLGVAYNSIALSGSCLLAYLLYAGFVKFYRRFSLEALMATAVTYPEATPLKDTED